MKSNTSPSRGRLLGNEGSGSGKNYDEERLGWGSAASTALPKKYLRLLKLRRTAMWLIIIDIVIVALVVRAFEPLITLLLRNEEMFGARLTLPLNASRPVDPTLEQHRIPRILHQTAATEKIPEAWVDLVKSCKEAYSDYEYKLWTDASARQFISEEYPWFVEIWDQYPFNIQRADALRYFVLHYYGGVYLDMDTLCNHTLPLDQIEADGSMHHAVFKSTTPTGVSNDLLITSARHPVFTEAIATLPFYNSITRFWAPLLPHAAIMVGSGPFFFSMAIKNYLLRQPSLPTPKVQVINATELLPYITDYESSSWHHGDTKTLMWVGDRPWIWFSLGGIGLVIGLYIINKSLLFVWRYFTKAPPSDESTKVVKLV